MTNSLKPIKLENIKTLSGKKDSKNNVYYYLDFKFNLHKMGDSANGNALFRIIPINFDNSLLKTFSKKSSPSKGYSTIESNDIKLTLKNTFDEVLRIKAKKVAAKKAYEKSLKERGVAAVIETVPVENIPKQAKKTKQIKKLVRKKVELPKASKPADNPFKKDKVANGNSFDKTFGKVKKFKKNEDFKRDRNFEKNESFNFDKENKENISKSLKKEKPNFSEKKKYSKKNDNDKENYPNKSDKNSYSNKKGTFTKNTNSKSSHKKRPKSTRNNF
ncbi:MAG: hypothetical protein ACRC41_12695 [Sarcina sp.]